MKKIYKTPSIHTHQLAFHSFIAASTGGAMNCSVDNSETNSMTGDAKKRNLLNSIDVDFSSDDK